HVAQHQHAQAGGVLHDRRQQAALPVPGQCIDVDSDVHVHSRTSMPCPRRNRLSAGIGTAPEWNTLAASAASTSASRNASAKCAIVPAPPEATSGTSQTARTACSCPMS